MFAVCELKGLRLIFENPATKPHYLFHSANFIPPTFIDRDVAKKRAENKDLEPIILKTKTASVISCDVVIPDEFCQAYAQIEEEN